jgi:HPt (histidine-containing phosphotransfer) domain-containing protein
MSDEKVFDREGAMDRVDNDLELFFELFDMLFDEYESSITIMRNAISEGDNKALEEAAHSCKSAFGNLGAMCVFKIAYELEKEGREGRASQCAETLEKFVLAVDEYKTMLQGER